MSSVKDAGSVEHLSSGDAIKKLQELIKDANVCHFVTNLNDIPLDARPMATQDVDDQGNIYFLSGADSHKNQHVQSDPRVQLFYTNSGGYEYLSIYGTATVTRDRKLIDEMWTRPYSQKQKALRF